LNFFCLVIEKKKEMEVDRGEEVLGKADNSKFDLKIGNRNSFEEEMRHCRENSFLKFRKLSQLFGSTTTARRVLDSAMEENKKLEINGRRKRSSIIK